MSTVRCDMSISVDGFVCGVAAQKPPFLDDRLFRITDWVFGEDDTAKAMTAERVDHAGAYVMGRRMYDSAGDRWSVESPYKTDVFVVTHLPHDPVALDDGTTFRFVTEGGVPAAVEAARAACPPGRKVHVSGGADVVRQALAADLIDELHLHLAPVLIGQGTRLFDGLPDRMTELEPVRVIDAPGVTHLSFRISHPQKG